MRYRNQGEKDQADEMWAFLVNYERPYSANLFFRISSLMRQLA